jgi:4-hydroxyphenylpyruvate dioxygenase-like putative hemolysin
MSFKGVFMSKQIKGNISELPPVTQVGIVVRAMDKAIDYYTTTFGWGPFKISEFAMKGANYNGRKIDCKIKMARARQPGIEIELIQSLEGDTPYTDFLKEKGEGLHHLGIRVEDVGATLAKLSEQGIRPVFSLSYPEIGLAFAYLNSDSVGGVMIEIMQMRRKNNI